MKQHTSPRTKATGPLRFAGRKFNPLYRFRRFLSYCLPLLLAAAVSACDKDDDGAANPLKALAGKCLEGRIIALKGCTSGVYVQLLNVETGTTSTYLGTEYKNVILLSHRPENVSYDETFDKTFYFTIDASRKFDHCFEMYDCNVVSGPDDPTDVTIKACIKSSSDTSCPA